jgi:shikimate dehydrogenase
MVKQFGLIGYPLGHSFSKKYFIEKFEKEGIGNCHYELYPIENIEKFPELVKNTPGLSGLNCTIPYKQDVKKYLNEIDDTAEKIGAVNTIKIFRDKGGFYLKGFNTDCYGFQSALKEHLATYHKNALVLGTGGSSKAVVYVLNKLGIDFKYVSRRKGDDILDYESLNEEIISNHKLIINTTPLGMSPDISGKPALPYNYISDKHYLFDLVYNPEETAFMKEGKKRGAKTKNGLEMLFGQAEKAWEIWNS